VAFLALYGAILPVNHWLARRRIGFVWSRAVKAQALVAVTAALMVEATARQSDMVGAVVGLVLGGVLGLWALVQLASWVGVSGRLGRIAALGERVKGWMIRR